MSDFGGGLNKSKLALLSDRFDRIVERGIFMLALAIYAWCFYQLFVMFFGKVTV